MKPKKCKTGKIYKCILLDCKNVKLVSEGFENVDNELVHHVSIKLK